MNDVINELNLELQNSDEIPHSGSIFDFSATFDLNTEQTDIKFDTPTSEKDREINYAKTPFDVELSEDQSQYGLSVDFLYKLDANTVENYFIRGANIKLLKNVEILSTNIFNSKTPEPKKSVLKLTIIVPKDLPIEEKTELKFDILLSRRKQNSNDNIEADATNLFIDPILIIGRPIPPR
ncbi:hypothetical protein [Pseudoalteromonas luteoviolacea]|uniref:Uncharacterized protein n=1 Tax=Pseudoalteromonas luteoviolacea H33 TaxID=1365251 RepID=A0A167ANY8_9GAMM|nr:hypothetical protein [Pseudoalteromonas luteoviolacea]KZN45625.1 hypothetical protein N476_25315 [Pseudoalteromonas luteoviolacea H33]KZN69728.1 hypothetical protein N477_26085 [Pseudoalteromonas luteoviolacea H33-S]MBQ4880136.1 hypothetical protein [Pseudoalteromonas luteoviolacea]MBQ4909205.1 hypothetical protein [Pseudoalteromonas luteoviolacea]